MESTAQPTAPPVPAVLLDYFTRTLGEDYLTSADDNGFNSFVQIFRSRPLSSEGGKSTETASQKSCVLKTPRNKYAVEALRRESKNIAALSPFFPVTTSTLTSSVIDIPRQVKDLEQNSLHHHPETEIYLNYLLPGTNAAVTFSSCTDAERLELVRSIAAALRALHSLSIPDSISEQLHCYGHSKPAQPQEAASSEEQSRSPTQIWLRQLLYDSFTPLTEAKASRVPHDQSLKESAADKEAILDDAKSALTRLEFLKSYADLPADDPFWTAHTNGRLVLVHGDFMLPNIMVSVDSGKTVINDGEDAIGSSKPGLSVSGLLDWGDCGLGDARCDLWSCTWSIQSNAENCGLSDSEGQALVDAFWDAYHSAPDKTASSGGGRTQKESKLEVWQAIYDAFDYLSF